MALRCWDRICCPHGHRVGAVLYSLAPDVCKSFAESWAFCKTQLPGMSLPKRPRLSKGLTSKYENSVFLTCLYICITSVLYVSYIIIIIIIIITGDFDCQWSKYSRYLLYHSPRTWHGRGGAGRGIYCSYVVIPR